MIPQILSSALQHSRKGEGQIRIAAADLIRGFLNAPPARPTSTTGPCPPWAGGITPLCRRALQLRLLPSLLSHIVDRLHPHPVFCVAPAYPFQR